METHLSTTPTPTTALKIKENDQKILLLPLTLSQISLPGRLLVLFLVCNLSFFCIPSQPRYIASTAVQPGRLTDLPRALRKVPNKLWDHASETFRGKKIIMCTRLTDVVTSVELSYTDALLRSGCGPRRTAFRLSGGRSRWLSCHLVTSSNNSGTFLPAAAEPARSSHCIIGLISAGRPSAPPPVWYTNKITHRLECNSYSSAWQIAARPEEIEKAGKVSGSWQWLWLWWSILLLPLLTLPNMRDLHSPPTTQPPNHPPTHTHTHPPKLRSKPAL